MHSQQVQNISGILSPKTWSMFTKCCGRKKHRIIRRLSLWGIYMSVAWLLASLQFQFLLISANPHVHLYRFAILTVWCAMCVTDIVISIPFTIDQFLIKKVEYGITPKQACRQINSHVHSSTCFGFGSLRNIQYYTCTTSEQIWRKDCVSTSMYYLLRHVAIPIVVWIVKRIVQKIRGRHIYFWRIIQE